ncbi:nucleoside hydrolase [Bacteroides sp.]|uniref:nucleoside hydrolase n=1 Tax=Bacteroides sp. TaxID=29523 RepID=UPI0026356DC0|nr:nucleoside hydrolase [Bacteroides sp.]
MANLNWLFNFFLLLFLYGCGFPSTKQDDKVLLILDTDLGPDYDDVGAMAVMHALADSGYVDILATVSSNKSELTVPCIEVINTFFNRPNISLGVAKSKNAVTLECPHERKWTEDLPQKYTHRTAKSSDAPDAVKIYRSALCTQPDSSVTICTIGAFSNLKELLQSKGDEVSAETGTELVRRKVKRLVSMAGMFPEGREYNIYCDASSSSFVAEHWPTEIVFCGFEIGYNIITGRSVSQMPVENNPIKDVFALSMSQGEPQGRWSWDQATVWVAIKGITPYYIGEHGTISIDSTGNNTWEAAKAGKHIRLIESCPAKDMEVLLEKYMMHCPKY